MSDALRQLHAAANVLADSGLRTIKTDDLCIAVYGAIDEITRLREALTMFTMFYPFGISLELDQAFRTARAALAETEKTNG